MILSNKGRQLLEGREGCKLYVYHDIRGLATIGYGHLIKAGEHFTTLTQAQADDLFKQDVGIYVDNLNSVLDPSVKLTQDQFDALVSFSFNIGIGGLNHSTALREVNAGILDGVGSAMMMWVKPTALISRREEEVEQFYSKI